jgi:hypothetical protein
MLGAYSVLYPAHARTAAPALERTSPLSSAAALARGMTEPCEGHSPAARSPTSCPEPMLRSWTYRGLFIRRLWYAGCDEA